MPGSREARARGSLVVPSPGRLAIAPHVPFETAEGERGVTAVVPAADCKARQQLGLSRKPLVC